jgi:hypothetical protein
MLLVRGSLGESSPNGAPMSLGRGRSQQDREPTLAPWRSARISGGTLRARDGSGADRWDLMIRTVLPGAYGWRRFHQRLGRRRRCGDPR